MHSGKVNLRIIKNKLAIKAKKLNAINKYYNNLWYQWAEKKEHSMKEDKTASYQSLDSKIKEMRDFLFKRG